jgi:hypothetical protein
VGSRAFPKLATVPFTSFDLLPGQMLYLPAGWAHEVTSFSSTAGGASTATVIHQALNYWFHPPTSSDFDHPYDDDYWRVISPALR